jgi:hypothetical protein
LHSPGEGTTSRHQRGKEYAEGATTRGVSARARGAMVTVEHGDDANEAVTIGYLAGAGADHL